MLWELRKLWKTHWFLCANRPMSTFLMLDMLEMFILLATSRFLSFAFNWMANKGTHSLTRTYKGEEKTNLSSVCSWVVYHKPCVHRWEYMCIQREQLYKIERMKTHNRCYCWIFYVCSRFLSISMQVLYHSYVNFNWKQTKQLKLTKLLSKIITKKLILKYVCAVVVCCLEKFLGESQKMKNTRKLDSIFMTKKERWVFLQRKSKIQFSERSGKLFGKLDYRTCVSKVDLFDENGPTMLKWMEKPATTKNLCVNFWNYKSHQFVVQVQKQSSWH